MTWDVQCPVEHCGAVFPIVAEVPPIIVQVLCPSCGIELVVDFRHSSAESQESGYGDGLE